MESCFDLVPFYLRKSQAEREFDKKQLLDIIKGMFMNNVNVIKMTLEHIDELCLLKI